MEHLTAIFDLACAQLPPPACRNFVKSYNCEMTQRVNAYALIARYEARISNCLDLVPEEHADMANDAKAALATVAGIARDEIDGRIAEHLTGLFERLAALYRTK